MITVTIAINGRVILARSAVNRGRLPGCETLTRYDVDDGQEIAHQPERGAVPLAIKMLSRIKEPLSEPKP